MKKSKLLVIGDGDAPTGYARVVHSLLPYWHSKYECHQLAINKATISGSYPWHIYPNDLKHDPHGFRKIQHLISEIKPDIIWLINNFHAIPLYDQKLKAWSPKSKIVIYFPLEGDFIRPAEFRSIVNVDLPVTYLTTGLNIARGHAIQHQEDERALRRFKAIDHGINRELFFPLVTGADGLPDLAACKKQAIQQLFGFNSQLQDSWIVLNGNRNRKGKDIPCTLEGFKLFSDQKPENVKLYLNMGKVDSAGDLGRSIRYYGLGDRVIVSREEELKQAYASEELNLLYNACEVGVNTSHAEGWGLVSFEHAATGRPQIVPNHSACRALWENTATLLSPDPGPSCYSRARSNTATNPEVLASALEEYYNNESFYEEMSRKAYLFTMQDRFSWEVISNQWLMEFDQLLGKEDQNTPSIAPSFM